MNWLQSVIFGLISGVSEFLPISGDAHRKLFTFFGGFESETGAMFFVRLGCLAAVITCYRKQLIRILRERGMVEHLPKKLHQALIAREENPEASLSELAAMMEPPITKPAMNHRLKKLAELAKEAVQ